MECWPRFADPADDTQQYKGWPISVNYLENYGKEALVYLPIIKVEGMERPVIQVIDEAPSEIVYTLRMPANTFRPKVFKEGKYMIKVGALKTARVKVLKSVSSLKKDESKTLRPPIKNNAFTIFIFLKYKIINPHFTVGVLYLRYFYYLSSMNYYNFFTTDNNNHHQKNINHEKLIENTSNNVHIHPYVDISNIGQTIH